MIPYLLFGTVLGAFAVTGGYFLWRSAKYKYLSSALDLSLFLVRIPQEHSDSQDKGSFKTEINLFEQLLSNMTMIKEPFVIEVAVPHVGEEICFFVAVPKQYSETAAKQIQGLWSGASVTSASDDYSIFSPQGAVAGAYVTQKEPAALPIRTYLELESDSFNPILGALTKVSEIGEGAAMQLIVRPSSGKLKKGVTKQIRALKQGLQFDRVLSPSMNWKEVKRAFNPAKKEENPAARIVDDEAVKMLTAKVSKPLFEVNLRLIASASSPFQANNVLEGLMAGFRQFGAPRRNDFRIVKLRNTQKITSQFIFRSFEPAQAMVLNSEEIASFCHFPTASTDTPKVKWLKSKEAPPPPNLPEKGTLLGVSSFRGQDKEIYIADDDRRRHIYVIGQTGTGKSTLLGDMLIEDVKHGKGIAVIDPHGDLCTSLLGHIPKDRLDDLIYFDPGDLWKPLGLNMLDFNPDRPEEKTFIVNEMQSIFNKLFSKESMGPMFEQYMRNALLLLMEDMVNEPATLTEVPRIFTDPEFRKRKLARIHNPLVIDFWEKEAVKAGGEASLANMTPYITSKFNNFISNDYMRPIIGQAKSAFNFREAMDSGKILLINLSKGRIGDINAGLLGMIFTGKILMAALSRVDVDQSKRRDFNLYIDEFQNFTTDSIATILSEARKYALTLTIAHQFIAQLEESIRDAVFGNVGSQVVFRVGAQDADFLVKQFEPVFGQNDLMNIDNLNAYTKLLIRGETSKPFNLRILPTSFSKGDPELAAKIKEYSREKYGMERQAVEKAIFERLRN
jgi:hypothetical protein